LCQKLGVREQQLTCFRESEATGPAVDEALAELRFERTNLLRDRRLRQ
jgi:hypothetical protein